MGEWLNSPVSSANSVITCYSAIGTGASVSPNNDPNAHITFAADRERFLQDGEVVVRKLIIKVKSQAMVTTYQCSMIIEDPNSAGTQYDRKDFQITVRS